MDLFTIAQASDLHQVVSVHVSRRRTPSVLFVQLIQAAAAPSTSVPKATMTKTATL